MDFDQTCCWKRGNRENSMLHYVGPTQLSFHMSLNRISCGLHIDTLNIRNVYLSVHITTAFLINWIRTD